MTNPNELLTPVQFTDGYSSTFQGIMPNGDAAWSSARDSYTLENSGSRNEDIAVGSALLSKAQASVEGYASALAQSRITAPFDGTITDVNMKIGEVVVPGLSAGENISIISTNLYNIEVYVPENAIGAMNIGNSANITMDAYGSGTIFPAHVYLVNPAETIIKGANSYKVTLRFDQVDTRIRSGLSVNAVITTATTSNALAVPTRTLITRDAQKFVLLKAVDGSFAEHAVTTGITGSDGYTEILSGLNENDVVASFGAQNY
jgi:RND family efflux transporter MFP subunit